MTQSYKGVVMLKYKKNVMLSDYNAEIKKLEDEINFIYMYPQGSMEKIRRLEKTLLLLKGDLK